MTSCPKCGASPTNRHYDALLDAIACFMCGHPEYQHMVPVSFEFDWLHRSKYDDPNPQILRML